MLLVAAILTVILGTAHSYLGERWIISPLLRQTQLPVIMGSQTATRQTLRAAWHITSLTWWGIAGLLAFLQFNTGSEKFAILWMVAITFVLFGLIPIIFGKGRHKSWILFFAVSAICAYSGVAS